jgi:hypothetical protein
MSEKKQKDTLYAIEEEIFIGYFFVVDMGRKICRLIITDILKSDKKAEDEFSLVCEYYSILYHIEAILEDIEKAAAFDEEKAQYLVGRSKGARLVIFLNSLLGVQSELVQKYNISLALH